VLDVGVPGSSNGEVAPALDLSSPTLGTLQVDTVREIAQYAGVTDPQISARELDSRCHGYIGSRPDLVMQSTTRRELEITALPDNNNLVLVVREPDGSFACDWGLGHPPRLRKPWGPGTRQLWVGNNSQGRRASFRLRISPVRSR
jgi:hypothetical protein